MSKIHKCLLAVTLLGVFLPGKGSLAINLRSASQDGIAFKYNPSNKIRPGLCNEIIELFELKTNVVITGLEELKTLPKIMNDLGAKKMDLFFCIIKTKNRIMTLDFLEPHLFTENLIAAVRADDPITVSSWPDIKSLKDNVILLVNGSAYADYLGEIDNLNIDDGAMSIRDNLKKLIHSRGRFYIGSEPSLKSEIAKMNIADKVRLLPWVVRTEAQYIAVRRDLNPDLKALLSKALTELRRTEAYKKILDKYDVKP